ncbi:MAG: hypothetical protein HY043_17440 [Verrucomicrobia bacterium]|nr:hypothetical protein [Verrucomicrobiota bacterium]
MHPSSWRIDHRVADLDAVTKWCHQREKVNRVLFSIRVEKQRGSWVPMSPTQLFATQKLLRDYIVDCFLASGWPGSRIFGAPALIFVAQFHLEVQKLIVKYGPRFSDWMDPHLPEDLCLFRVGSTHPTLVSVTHECDAWLITQRPARLMGITQSDELPELEQFIFKGKHFCRHWRGKGRFSQQQDRVA